MECTGRRSESGVLGNFLFFMLPEAPQQRGPTADEQEATRRAQDCIQECHVEQLIMESKFLRVDSLQELLKVCQSAVDMSVKVGNFCATTLHENCFVNAGA